MKVIIRGLYEDIRLPERAHKDDVGLDCFIHSFKSPKEYNLEKIEADGISMFPGQRVLCGLGFAMEIPEGYYAQIVPRSGHAIFRGLTILNSPGTIDSGYRGEVGAIVSHQGDQPLRLVKGLKICQLIVRKQVEFKIETDKILEKPIRGEDGFGSTGAD